MAILLIITPIALAIALPTLMHRAQEQGSREATKLMSHCCVEPEVE